MGRTATAVMAIVLAGLALAAAGMAQQRPQAPPAAEPPFKIERWRFVWTIAQQGNASAEIEQTHESLSVNIRHRISFAADTVWLSPQDAVAVGLELRAARTYFDRMLAAGREASETARIGKNRVIYSYDPKNGFRVWIQIERSEYIHDSVHLDLQEAEALAPQLAKADRMAEYLAGRMKAALQPAAPASRPAGDAGAAAQAWDRPIFCTMALPTGADAAGRPKEYWDDLATRLKGQEIVGQMAVAEPSASGDRITVNLCQLEAAGGRSVMYVVKLRTGRKDAMRLKWGDTVMFHGRVWDVELGSLVDGCLLTIEVDEQDCRVGQVSTDPIGHANPKAQGLQKTLLTIEQACAACEKEMKRLVATGDQAGGTQKRAEMASLQARLREARLACQAAELKWRLLSADKAQEKGGL